MSQQKRGAKSLPRYPQTSELLRRLKLCGLSILRVSELVPISYSSLRFKLMGHVGWTEEEWKAVNKVVNKAEKEHLANFSK